MTKESLVACTCDLCEESKTVRIGIPKGWIEISVDGMNDRDWIDKLICEECQKKIDEAKLGLRS